MHRAGLFRSFLQGGFECSSHRYHDSGRLDLLAATAHDRFAQQDYRSLRGYGLHTLRDGLRWHLIERSPGRYDWSSFLPMLRAARHEQVQVIWDLCHYGWPDHVDIWQDFPERLARFAAAAATLVRGETGEIPFYCPVNEISYWAWAGGDMARMHPAARGRGMELKVQLARAVIAAVDAVRTVEPRARFVQVDPAIHVAAADQQSRQAAEDYRQAQFQAWDMLVGRQWPQLGGGPRYLDIVGVNYYPDNQWFLGGGTIWCGEPQYRPFHQILAEVHRRYDRPLLIAETGAEGTQRAPWLRYVGNQAMTALEADVPLEGICLYPVLDYPGWADGRLCQTGLLGFADEQGRRPLYPPLLHELAAQQARFDRLRGESAVVAA